MEQLSQEPVSVLTPVRGHPPVSQVRMEKFWASEDLVEELLPFLDLHSIMALASVHDLTLAVIHRDVVWQGVLLKTFKTKSELVVQEWEEKVDLLMDLINLMSDKPEEFKDDKNVIFEEDFDDEKEIFEEVEDDKDDIFEEVVDDKSDIFEEVVDAKSDIFEEVVDEEEDIFEEVIDDEEDIFEDIEDDKNDAFEEVIDDEEDICEEVEDDKNDVFEEVIDDEKDLFEDEKDTFEDVFASHLLQSVLDQICSNFPPTPGNCQDKEMIRVSFAGDPVANGEPAENDFAGNPAANDKLLSPIGFVLLERLRTRMRMCSNLFTVREVQVESWEIVGESLSSAISRQDEQVELFDWISESASVEDLLAMKDILNNHCKRFQVELISRFFHFYWSNDPHLSLLQEGRDGGWEEDEESWKKITLELLEITEADIERFLDLQELAMANEF